MTTLGLGHQPLGTSPLGTGLPLALGLTLHATLRQRTTTVSLTDATRLTATVRPRQLTATVED